MSLHLEEFVKYYQSEFPGKPVPPMPKSPKELNITERLALANWNSGILYQNLFGNSGLGQNLAADTQLRLQRGEINEGDAPALRAANLEYYAQQAEAMKIQRQDAAMEETTRRAREAAAQAQAKQQRWANASLMERLAMSDRSQESIEQARRQWGITGLADWQKGEE